MTGLNWNKPELHKDLARYGRIDTLPVLGQEKYNAEKKRKKKERKKAREIELTKMKQVEQQRQPKKTFTKEFIEHFKQKEHQSISFIFYDGSSQRIDNVRSASLITGLTPYQCYGFAEWGKPTKKLKGYYMKWYTEVT